MPSVEIEIGSRRYSIACRSGEEEHLRSVAAIVDRKAHDAAGALGNLGESRQLLFASLLLADELQEKGSTPQGAGADSERSGEADRVADALERLAERMESLAERLETNAPTSYIEQ